MPPAAPETPRTRSVGHLALDVAIYLALLNAANGFWIRLIQRIQETKAVLAHEFPALYTAYAWLGTQEVAHSVVAVAIAAAVAFAWRRGSFGEGRLAPAFAGSAIALELATPLLSWLQWPAAVALSLLALTVGSRRIAARPKLAARAERLADKVRRFSYPNVISAAADLVLIGAVVGVGLSVLEGVLYTRGFTGELFATDDFYAFLAYAAANAIFYCWTRGAAILLFVSAVLFLGARPAVRRGWLPAAALPGLLSLFVTGVFVGLALPLVLFIFGSEIAAIGLLELHIALAASLAFLLAAAGQRNVQAIYARPDPSSGREAFRTELVTVVNGLTNLAILPLSALLHKRSARFARTVEYLGSIVILVAAGTALVWKSYPSLHDYSTVVTHIYATALILLTFVCTCLIAHWQRPTAIALPRRRLALTLGAAACAVLLLTIGDADANARVIAHEYAVVNKVFGQKVIELGYQQRTLPGLSEPAPHPEFAFHPPGAERLPENPGLAKPEGTPPPIFVILVDALRADRLSAHGQERPLTPNIDALADESVVFERAYSASSATSCGVRCLFSGRYASRYMLEKNTPQFFTQDLYESGYRGFLISTWDSDYNAVSLPPFLRHFSEAQREDVDMRQFPHYQDHTMAEKAVEGVAELRADLAARPEAERGLFHYLHLTSPHFPWGERPFGETFGETPEDMYDHNVSYADHAVGIFLDGLKELGLYDDAIIVICADHGTGLMDHGRYAGFYCYEEQIRVPLVIRMPGVAARRVAEPVSLVDLGPTLVNVSQRDVPNRFHGISLLPLMTGEQESTGRAAIYNLCAFNDAYGIIYRSRWKYIVHRREGYRQLFDLDADPKETRNLADERPEIDETLDGLMQSYLWEGRKSYANPYHFKPFEIE